MSATALKTATADEFYGRMLDILNAGALSLMVSLGHRAGLFDTMAAMPPATVAEIARRAGLAERYVREWLAAMVTGGIVTYHPGTETYYLPPAHAANLTRAASPDNLAVQAQQIACLAGLEDRILACFRHGGGLTHDAYGPRLAEITAEASAQTVVAVLHDAILPLVPGLVRRLRQGIDVLDVGCGAAGALVSLAERYPMSRFFGYDRCDHALGTARREIAERRLTNVTVMRQDAATMPECDAYDLVTAFGAIAEQADPAAVLGNVHRALREGGVFLMHDVAGASRLEDNLEHPVAPLLYTLSTLHATPVSLGHGGPGLGGMWGQETAQAMLRQAGFQHVTVRQIAYDVGYQYYIAPKPVRVAS